MYGNGYLDKKSMYGNQEGFYSAGNRLDKSNREKHKKQCQKLLEVFANYTNKQTPHTNDIERWREFVSYSYYHSVKLLREEIFAIFQNYSWIESDIEIFARRYEDAYEQLDHFLMWTCRDEGDDK